MALIPIFPADRLQDGGSNVERVEPGALYRSGSGYLLYITRRARHGMDCSLNMIEYINLDPTFDSSVGSLWVMEEQIFLKRCSPVVAELVDGELEVETASPVRVLYAQQMETDGGKLDLERRIRVRLPKELLSAIRHAKAEYRNETHRVRIHTPYYTVYLKADGNAGLILDRILVKEDI